MSDLKLPGWPKIVLALGVCLVLLNTSTGLAMEISEPDSLAHTSSTLILPVIGYTPDTGLMLGGTVLRLFHLEPEYGESRPSSISPVVIYTLKNQLMLFMGSSWNWDENRNSLNVVPSYTLFPDQFYGIGRDVNIENEEDYTSESINLELDFNRQVYKNWRLGLSYRLKKHRLDEMASDGLLASGTIEGTETSWFTGVGPALILDTRDNIWAPKHGLWLQSSVRFGGKSMGGDYTSQEYSLDLRSYWKIGENLVIAGQYMMNHLEGDSPFFAMGRLGGADGLRGYRGGLYMDKSSALGRVELRRSSLWGSMGAVAFAGLGDVAPSLDKLTLAAQLWTVGFGLRYMLDSNERINIRADFGFGNGDSGFYLSFGEAF